MRIADNSMGTGIAIEREEGDSQELNVIATRIMPEWLELFARKNRDYGSGSAYELGVRGQYSDIHRKMIKLKRAMWDGEELDFEDTDEIIKDLISHLFLTLHMFGLQREAGQAYVYNHDDAAVDAFFRMVGGDAENALKMSGVLTEPFRTLVRDRATALLSEKQAESEHAASLSDGEDKPVRSVSEWAAEAQKQMAERLRRGEDERLYGARAARRRAREEREDAGEAEVSASPYAGSYGFDSPTFGDSDAEQHGVGHNHFPYGAELVNHKPRIVTELVDGKSKHYHEEYPGADREPLALVPKALIERLLKDHCVLGEEQKAGLLKLQEWAERSFN